MKEIDSKKLDVVYDHYKDSFVCSRNYNKLRESLFNYVLIIIFLQFLQISLSAQYLELSNAVLQKQIGVNLALNKELINGFLWFLLFSFSFKYFQANVLVNRHYHYLHKLENKIDKIVGEKDFITREGKNYLESYPLFSDWAHTIYTWIFPFLLLAVASFKMFFCVALDKQSAFALHVGSFFLLGIYISTILYLIAIHKNSD